MGGGAFDVLAGAALDVRRLLIGYVANRLGRDADYEALGRELAALGNDGARCDDGAVADLRTVEDGRAHANEAVVSDLTPVHDRVMADDAALADDRRIAGIRMQD